MQKNCNNLTGDDFYTAFENDMRETYGGKCADDVQEIPEIDVNALTAEDFTEKNDIYKSLLSFGNTIELEEFVNSLRQRAKLLKCKCDFETRVKPYLKTAQQNIRDFEKFQKLAERQSKLQDFPPWFDGEHIFDDEFCKDFLKKHSMKCINQRFFDVDGVIPDAEIQQQIYNMISPYILSKHADYVKRLFNALRIKAYAPQPENDYHYIHMKNGTLNIDGTFTAEKVICLNRLNVDYVPNCGKPEKFLKYLDDLLYPEDIPTLQEYIGYSCTTSTKAQQALFVIGRGGEGKSRLTLILRALLGAKNVSSVKITNIQSGSYLLESLDQNLLNIDDDLSANKIEETSLFKQFVTAETPVRLNPKFKPPYDAQIYCKFLTFGNNCFNALYDNSDGFFRRQIILKTKDKSPDRRDNAFLAEEIINEELPQIFLWAFEGLQRLVKNGFHLTVSDRAKQNLEESRSESNNLREFLSIGNNSDNGYFVYDADADITSKEFYDVYNWWCNDNGYILFKQKTFSQYLKENADALNVVPSQHILNADGRQVRGYKGIKKTYKIPDYYV